MFGDEIEGVALLERFLFDVGAAVLRQVQNGHLWPAFMQGARHSQPGQTVAAHVGVQQRDVRRLVVGALADMLAGRFGEFERRHTGFLLIELGLLQHRPETLDPVALVFNPEDGGHNAMMIDRTNPPV